VGTNSWEWSEMWAGTYTWAVTYPYDAVPKNSTSNIVLTNTNR